jgi:hypothetical protein
MSLRLVLATALLTVAIIAAASVNLQYRLECPDGIHAATVSYYGDRDRTKEIQSHCLYVTQNSIDNGYGAFSCANAALPIEKPFYGKIVASEFPDLQLHYKLDQSCPTGGGAAFAVLSQNDACFLFNQDGDGTGLLTYPNGGPLP